ncbi:uncharacterized protein LOC144579619 isoform X3 [Callithrix jacchus]
MGLTLAWSRAGHFPRTPKTRRFRGLLRCHLRRGHFLKGRTPDFREPGTSGVVLASAHARGAQCSLGHADVSGCSVMGSWDVTKDDAPEAVCQEQGSGPSPPGRPHKRWARRKKPQVKGVPGKQRDPSLRPAPKGSSLQIPDRQRESAASGLKLPLRRPKAIAGFIKSLISQASI